MMKRTTKVALVATGATLGGLYLLGRWAQNRTPTTVSGAVNAGANRVFQSVGVGAQNPFYPQYR